MKKIISSVLLLAVSMIVSAQNKMVRECAAITDEGVALYRSEIASWRGTEVFLAKFKGHKVNSGGYFSYTEGDFTKCIFFSKEENPKVICMIIFDDSYDIRTSQLDSTQRGFTAAEKDLFIMRQKTIAQIDADTLFKTYEHTDLNVVPIVFNGEKKVYVMTGPSEDSMLIFGNDYVLTFDKDNYLLSKQQIHQNIIVSDVKEQIRKGANIKVGVHTHAESKGDLMTPTDVCTLMLYEESLPIEQYFVISPKYVSIWNCKSDKLVAITKEAWDKINNPPVKKKSKNKTAKTN